MSKACCDREDGEAKASLIYANVEEAIINDTDSEKDIVDPTFHHTVGTDEPTAGLASCKLNLINLLSYSPFLCSQTNVYFLVNEQP